MIQVPRGEPFTLALGQMPVALGVARRNVTRGVRVIAEAADRGAQLLLLPELWASGFDLARAEEHAEFAEQEVVPAVAAAAREQGIWVLGSLLLPAPRGGVANTAVLAGPPGVHPVRYAKIHLFPPMDEVRHLVPGSDAPLLPLPWCDAGVLVCYDLRFPELCRAYALRGAAIVLVTAQWPAVRASDWRTLLRARAIENQCYVAGCNRVGQSGDTRFGGHSAVVDPSGVTLVEDGSRSVVLTARIDPTRVNEARHSLPVLANRRPDVYSSLLEVS